MNDNIKQLKKALGVLNGEESSREYKIDITPEQQSKVNDWYKEEAIKARNALYLQRITQSTTESDKTQQRQAEARKKANDIALSFAKSLGAEKIGDLPGFQLEIIAGLCLMHLGIKSSLYPHLEASKGLFVGGNTQIGKTAAFLHCKSQGLPFRAVTSYQLKEMAAEEGEEALKEYSSKGYHLLIDEIGHETKAQSFGNLIDSVEIVIHERDRLKLKTSYTSNMRLDDLKERYSPHIVARIAKSNIIKTEGSKQWI